MRPRAIKQLHPFTGFQFMQIVIKQLARRCRPDASTMHAPFRSGRYYSGPHSRNISPEQRVNIHGPRKECMSVCAVNSVIYDGSRRPDVSESMQNDRRRAWICASQAHISPAQRAVCQFVSQTNCLPRSQLPMCIDQVGLW